MPLLIEIWMSECKKWPWLFGFFQFVITQNDRGGIAQWCGLSLIPGHAIIIMWVEFVVGSHPCSERFFSGYSGFPSP